MANPDVTVLICTRDRQDQLLHCLESINNQDYPSMEIIVVDNGSKKVSIPQLDYRYRIRFFSQPVAGLSFARNSVLSNVEGEVIALLDDDAIAERDWIKNAITHFEDSTVGSVTGKVLPLEIKNEWQEKQIATGWAPNSDLPANFESNNFNPLISSPGTGTNIFVRTSCFNSIRFPELFGPGTPVYAADEHYLYYEIVKSGWKIRYEPQSVVFHDYVATEVEFRKRIFRCTVSRSAFLTKFALSENGFRRHTWKYIFGKLSPSKRAIPGVPGEIRTKAFLLGPFALMRSVINAKVKYKDRFKQCSLIAEFPGIHSLQSANRVPDEHAKSS